MKPELEKYIVEMLDAQYAYVKERQNDKAQKAYYNGLVLMLNCVLSEGYTNEKHYVMRLNGKHYIIHEE